MQKYHSIDNFNPMRRTGLKGGNKSKDSGGMELIHHAEQNA